MAHHAPLIALRHSPNWPHGGEIDIIETINQQSTNQYALHTDAGCTPTANTTLGTPTGQTGTNTCDQAQNYGSGCTVLNQNTASAGAGFAAAGGGVYVMAFEVSKAFKGAEALELKTGVC